MKKTLSIALCAILLIFLLPVRANAAPTAWVHHDPFICVGGIYDAWAHISEGADRASYQWQVDASFGDGSWYDLDESAGTYGYKGVKTDHLQFVTQYKDGSYEIGTGWEDIPFRCRITLDGKTYYTDEFCMNIENTGRFQSELQTLSPFILARNWDNVTYVKEEKGINYGWSEAGTQLNFFFSNPQPTANTILQFSDVRLVPEIIITENGKVTRGSNSLQYTPTIIATNEVLVEYNVRAWLGANDMGICASEKMVISTVAPAGGTEAIAKYDMSLLKEMYTQSVKLVSIPKNATVLVHENIGGTWYKASYNGFVGYVPTSALTVNTASTITTVNITLDEPAIGDAPWYNPPVNTEGCELYLVDPVSWYDLETNRFMQPSETFREGHAYRVQIWLSAKDGYQFLADPYGNIQTKCYINGREAKAVKAYEQDPEKVIEVTYTYGALVSIHTCKVSLVKRVEPTCTENGHEAYFHCDCGMNYADGRAQQPVDIRTWGIIPATGHTPSGWRTTQVYHYRVCTGCGEMLDEQDHLGGAATCTQKANCTVCGYAYGREEPDHRWGPGWDYKDASGHAWVCADCKAHSQVKPHTPGPAATQTTPQTCSDCGYILEPVKGHTHQLTLVPQTPPTCTQEGNEEYYVCSGCSLLFSDPEGSNIIADPSSIAVGPLGHTVFDDWDLDEEYHWRICRDCGTILDETRMLHELVGGICATCGWDQGSGGGIQEPQTPPQETPNVGISLPGANTIVTLAAMLLIGLVCFGAAITATVIILKRK